MFVDAVVARNPNCPVLAVDARHPDDDGIPLVVEGALTMLLRDFS